MAWEMGGMRTSLAKAPCHSCRAGLEDTSFYNSCSSSLPSAGCSHGNQSRKAGRSRNSCLHNRPSWVCGYLAHPGVRTAFAWPSAV